MLTQENVVEIRVLARQGLGPRQIARVLGVSKNTVKRYLRTERAPRYKPRTPRPTKLDAYKDYLCERVGQAKPHWLPATVLLREIQALGYRGGITRLKTFLAPFKSARREEGPPVRFETQPGEQMQVDFVVLATT